MMNALVGVARGPFLLLSVTLVAAGAAAGAYEGGFRWSRTALALVISNPQNQIHSPDAWMPPLMVARAPGSWRMMMGFSCVPLREAEKP